MKKYFPDAVAGDYLGDMQTGPDDEEFIPGGLDVCYFTSYTKFHPERPHAWVYGNLISNAPDWKNAGKTVYLTTEAFGQALEVNARDPDLNTTKKVADRHESQVVMGILGGAQGVFSYAYKYAEGTPGYTGWEGFKPKYEEVWPWIMNDNRTLLATDVTSGRTNITSDPGGEQFLLSQLTCLLMWMAEYWLDRQVCWILRNRMVRQTMQPLPACLKEGMMSYGKTGR